MGLDADEVDRRVKQSARFVGLEPAVLEKSPFDLSGGQKRRVAIAGVIAMEPRVLVLDAVDVGELFGFNDSAHVETPWMEIVCGESIERKADYIHHLGVSSSSVTISSVLA